MRLDPNYATKLNSLIEHYNLTDFDKKHMPDLDKYSKSTGSSGTDVSGSAFKPFSFQMLLHRIHMVNVLGMCTNVFNNLINM